MDAYAITSGDVFLRRKVVGALKFDERWLVTTTYPKDNRVI